MTENFRRSPACHLFLDVGQLLAKLRQRFGQWVSFGLWRFRQARQDFNHRLLPEPGQAAGGQPPDIQHHGFRAQFRSNLRNGLLYGRGGE